MVNEQLLRWDRRQVLFARRHPGRRKLVETRRLEEAQADLVQARCQRNGGGSPGGDMNAAVVDDDMAINLDGGAVVGPRRERVVAIPIGAQPTVPFDAELFLR